MVGRTLAHYTVGESLGTGGMGIVYKATDTRLGRTVALKLLHENLSHDSERAARFEREARLLASLNHPNIGGIHGVEECGDRMILVLEYVPGDTLAERLAKGPLPVRSVLAIGAQIADALEAAHDRSVIHRDLKPANIKVTDTDAVKVLDFGLAKALETLTGTGSGDTMTADATVGGVILGTAPYMSPEQACGKPVDARTDVWSFGCVLYEALTGRRAFSGDSATEIIAGIVERDPDWSVLERSGVPRNVQQLFRRCLQKDPRARLRNIGDARIELEESMAGKILAPVPERTRSWGLPAALAAAGVVASGLIAGGWMWTRPATALQPVVRFTIDLAQG